MLKEVGLETALTIFLTRYQNESIPTKAASVALHLYYSRLGVAATRLDHASRT